MKAILYLRYSPRPIDKTVNPQDHDSLETQRVAVTRYCEFNGLDIVTEFADPLTSGKLSFKKRDGGAKLLAYLDENPDVTNIVFHRIDRAFRNVEEGISQFKIWRRSGITCHAADTGASVSVGTANGWLTVTMQLVFAEHQRLLTVERTTESMQKYQRDGRRMSCKVPFGFRRREDDGKMIERHPEEQAAIAKAMELSAAGVSSRAIASVFNAEGRQCRGAKWHKTTIDRILKRAAEEEKNGAA